MYVPFSGWFVTSSGSRHSDRLFSAGRHSETRAFQQGEESHAELLTTHRTHTRGPGNILVRWGPDSRFSRF